MKMARTPGHPIDPIFLNRWSPRAYDKTTMPESDLLTILEAARWAPSAFNIQPWRFLYSRRGDEHWQNYLKFLDPFNAAWANQASALVFVLSDKIAPGYEGGAPKLSRYNSFDAGAAWAQLALQATSLGYHAHAMAGLNFKHLKDHPIAPERYRVEIAVAIGKSTDPSVLPEDLRDEEQPSQRRSINEIAFAGTFPQ